MDSYALVISMFPVLFLCIFVGFPVSFCLISLSFFYGIHVFGGAIGHQMLGIIYNVCTSYEYAAVPLFVFMGVILESSGLAERLFKAINMWTGRIPGGLAVGTIVMCTIFAAASGIVGAVEVVVGVLAIPAMLKYGYNKAVIAGSICAGGALGTIIPPSIIAVVYAPMANISVGGLLLGIVFPGLILASTYIVYLLLRCIIRPQDGPRTSKEEHAKYTLKEKLRITAESLLPPVILIFAVMGSLLVGIAAPTEAAALGALGAVLLCAYNRKLTFHILNTSLVNTMMITSMILLIVVGGNSFASVFLTLGGGRLIETFVQSLNLTPLGMAMMFLFICFIAGFILDCFSIMLVFIPIFAPLVVKSGIDPLWFAVLFMLIIQTSYITPPMAPSIFYLKGIAPPEITINDMFMGVIPFIVCQWVAIFIVWFYPPLATWLPSVTLGFK